MVLRLEPLRQHPDRRRFAPVQTLHLQQQMVLLGRDADLARRDFADAQKAPDLIAEVRERVVVDAWGVIPVASRRAEHRSDNIMT